MLSAGDRTEWTRSVIEDIIPYVNSFLQSKTINDELIPEGQLVEVRRLLQ